MNQERDAFAGSMFRRLFAPAVISSVGLALSDMADAIVVGRRMGEVGLAAIGMSLPLYMALNICMHGFGIGGSVRYAKLLGEGDREGAVLSFNRVLRASLALSLLIALAINLFPALFLRLMGTTPDDGELYAEGKKRGVFAKKADGSDYLVDFGEFYCGVVDFTNPEAYNWFKDEVIKKYTLDIGIDGRGLPSLRHW